MMSLVSNIPDETACGSCYWTTGFDHILFSFLFYEILIHILNFVPVASVKRKLVCAKKDF